jgi:hypothetical protein
VDQKRRDESEHTRINPANKKHNDRSTQVRTADEKKTFTTTTWATRRCNPCRPLSSPTLPVLGSQILCYTKRETRAQGCSAAPPVWPQETRHPLSRRRRRRHSAMRCRPRVAVPSTHTVTPCAPHTPQQRLAVCHRPTLSLRSGFDRTSPHIMMGTGCSRTSIRPSHSIQPCAPRPRFTVQ